MGQITRPLCCPEGLLCADSEWTENKSQKPSSGMFTDLIRTHQIEHNSSLAAFMVKGRRVEQRPRCARELLKTENFELRLEVKENPHKSDKLQRDRAFNVERRCERWQIQKWPGGLTISYILSLQYFTISIY